MTDLPIITPQNHELTEERRSRIAAANEALAHITTHAREGLGARPVSEEVARLIALPLDQRSDIEAILRAAHATKIRCSGALKAHASGHSISASEAVVARQRQP